MNDNRSIDGGKLFTGLLLMAIGTLFLFDRLGYADFHFVIEHYWPLFLVALGAARLLDRRKPWSGLWLIVIGLWLQATTLHLWDLTFDSSWPLLVIAVGAMMVLRTIFGTMQRHEEEVRHDG